MTRVPGLSFVPWIFATLLCATRVNADSADGDSERVYQTLCAACHGATAEGALGPKLRSNPIIDHPNSAVAIEIIENGKPGTAMPGFGQHLGGRAGVLAMIAYLRTPVARSAETTQWRQLFNGRDLSGWEHVGDGSFVVQDNILQTRGGMGLLYWKADKIQSSILRVVYRTRGPNDNSGVYVRIPLPPIEPWMPVHYGSEIQIDAEPERWGEDDHYYSGSIYSQTRPLARPPMRSGKEWNTMEIHLDGLRTVVMLNGVKVTDHKEGDPVTRLKSDAHLRFDPRPAAGYVGLQNHSDKDVVEFKEISLRPIEKARPR